MTRVASRAPKRELEIAELRSNRILAIERTRVAVDCLNDPEERAGGLLALRAVAEAYGGLGAVAAQAGISRESLYRTLSPKGNPTLKPLVAVLKAVGLRLSVEQAQPARVRRTKAKADRAA